MQNWLRETFGDLLSPGFYIAGLLFYSLGLITNFVIPRVTDVIKRRSRRIAHRRAITVIVDRKKFSRRCFWKDVLKRNVDLRLATKFRFVPTADAIRSNPKFHHRLLNDEASEFVIINWDALNGDPIYGSDLTYSFFEHYSPDLLRWLEDGGVLLVESQGISWRASRRVYDFFGRLVNAPVSITAETNQLGTEVERADNDCARMLLPSVLGNALVLSDDFPGALNDWFPKSLDIYSTREARRHPRKVYRGWFVKYDGWIPLVVTGQNKYPVMIVKQVGHGICVLSTMFLASSGFSPLIKDLLMNLDPSTFKDLTAACEPRTDGARDR